MIFLCFVFCSCSCVAVAARCSVAADVACSVAACCGSSGSSIRVPLQEAARNAHIAQNKIPWHSKRIHGVQGQESDRTLCRLQGLNHSIPDAGGQSGGWPLNSRLRRAYSMRRFSRTQCILPAGRVEEGMERWMMGYGGAHSFGDQETSWDG